MVLPTTTRRMEASGAVAPHLGRLVDFAEPKGDDICLDLACGGGPLPAAIGPRVRHVAAVDALPADGTRPDPDGRTPTVQFGRGTPPFGVHAGDPDTPTVRADPAALPYRDGAFTLVTSRFSLYQLVDPGRTLREMVRVCRPAGRLVIAELVRPATRGEERDRLERLRDPGHPGTLSVHTLSRMISAAGADIRRLDVFTVERPVEPWLAGTDPTAADRIRDAMIDEVDGGPRTGTRPRVIGGELWFTQYWAHLAAQPRR